MKHSLLRFLIAGATFTAIGPSIFWLAIPLGGLLAFGIAETTTHMIRFLVFRKIVFPERLGYSVNLPSYLISIIPVSILCGTLVFLLEERVDRQQLTFFIASASVATSFIWSRWIYRKSYLGKVKM